MYRQNDKLHKKMSSRMSNAMYKAGYTYVTLAEKLGCAENTTRCWMTGKKTPSLIRIIEMSVIFNCSTDYLLVISKDFGELKVDSNSVDISVALYFMGDRIRNAQMANGYSNAELAWELDVKQCTVSNWLSGRSVPNILYIVKLAQLLNVSTDYLLGLDISDVVTYKKKTDNLTECSRAAVDSEISYGKYMAMKYHNKK